MQISRVGLDLAKRVIQVHAVDRAGRIGVGVTPIPQTVNKAGAATEDRRDRFEAARDKARVKWRTDELMALLRSPD